VPMVLKIRVLMQWADPAEADLVGARISQGASRSTLLTVHLRGAPLHIPVRRPPRNHRKRAPAAGCGNLRGLRRPRSPFAA
jgi:hypothetical protein